MGCFPEFKWGNSSGSGVNYQLPRMNNQNTTGSILFQGKFLAQFLPYPAPSKFEQLGLPLRVHVLCLVWVFWLKKRKSDGARVNWNKISFCGFFFFFYQEGESPQKNSQQMPVSASLFVFLSTVKMTWLEC